MSVHKKKNGNGPDPAVVVGVGQRKSFVNLHSKLAGLMGGCLVVLVLAVTGTIMLVNHFDKSTTQRAAKKTATVKSPWQPAAKADYLAYNGDYNAAQQVLTKQLASASTKQAKQFIYMQQTSTAINAKRYDDAFGYAQMAEKVFPTDRTAGLIAQVAQLRGDSNTARIYYQKAIDRLDKKSNTYQRDLAEYQAALGAV